MTEIIALTAGAPLLEAFYRGIYWSEFAAQHEPLAIWQAALRGELAYELMISVATDHTGAIHGGICFEHYPRSGCGLITYMVIAPEQRGRGLGEQLQRHAVRSLVAAGAPAVFGEINDPRITSDEPSAVAWKRLERNVRWGARVVDARYVQPALAPGLARDRGLVLIALADSPLPPMIDGSLVRSFVAELYAVTEGGEPDPEISIGEHVALLDALPRRDT